MNTFTTEDYRPCDGMKLIVKKWKEKVLFSLLTENFK